MQIGSGEEMRIQTPPQEVMYGICVYFKGKGCPITTI